MNIRQLQQEMKKEKLPKFTHEISCKTLGLPMHDVDGQLEYFTNHAMEIKNQMEIHGAVIFRDFDLMKTQEGFQQFYNAVGMKPCLDPLHSVSARPTVDGTKNSPVYEAVNKESRKNFFIGTCVTLILLLLLLLFFIVSWGVQLHIYATSTLIFHGDIDPVSNKQLLW